MYFNEENYNHQVMVVTFVKNRRMKNLVAIYLETVQVKSRQIVLYQKLKF